MIRKLFIFALIQTPIFLAAKINISKQYPFSITMLEQLETKLQLAHERDSEFKQYPVFYEIDEKNKISLWCPAHQPDKDGMGCSLNFQIALPEGASLTLNKKLSIKNKLKEVQTKLNITDPNKTQEHQHFGSIFTAQDTFTSHFFCEPSGATGAKTWQCFLFVNESIN